MKFHNSNHVSSPLKGMIHKHNNIQGNKMIKHSIHEQSFMIILLVCNNLEVNNTINYHKNFVHELNV